MHEGSRRLCVWARARPNAHTPSAAEPGCAICATRCYIVVCAIPSSLAAIRAIRLHGRAAQQHALLSSSLVRARGSRACFCARVAYNRVTASALALSLWRARTCQTNRRKIHRRETLKFNSQVYTISTPLFSIIARRAIQVQQHRAETRSLACCGRSYIMKISISAYVCEYVRIHICIYVCIHRVRS